MEQRHRERTKDQLLQDVRLSILLSMCPTDVEKQLTAQQHLLTDYAQMWAHIMTVINSRSRGPAPRMMGNFDRRGHSNDDASSDGSWKVKMENSTVWKSGTARESSTYSPAFCDGGRLSVAGSRGGGGTDGRSAGAWGRNAFWAGGKGRATNMDTCDPETGDCFSETHQMALVYLSHVDQLAHHCSLKHLPFVLWDGV